jgi:hypothetical protein
MHNKANDLMTALPSATATDALANSVAAWVLDADMTVLSVTPFGTRMFGHAGMVGQHIADVFDGTLEWTFTPWVNTDTQTDFLAYLFKHANENGGASQTLHLVNPNRMLYPATITVFKDPNNGRYLVRICPYDPYTCGIETGAVMLGQDGSMGGHDGMKITQEETDLLRAYAEVDSLDELAEASGKTRRQVDYALKMLCQKYECENVTELMKQYMRRFLQKVPRPQNTLKCATNFVHHDRIRHRVIPNHRLPEEAAEKPMPDNQRKIQRDKFAGLAN